MKWWQSVQRWYARKYMCPVWGCKSDEQSWWEESDGMVVVLGRAGRICENCGEAIDDDDTGGTAA